MRRALGWLAFYNSNAAMARAFPERLRVIEHVSRGGWGERFPRCRRMDRGRGSEVIADGCAVRCKREGLDPTEMARRSLKARAGPGTGGAFLGKTPPSNQGPSKMPPTASEGLRLPQEPLPSRAPRPEQGTARPRRVAATDRLCPLHTAAIPQHPLADSAPRYSRLSTAWTESSHIMTANFRQPLPSTRLQAFSFLVFMQGEPFALDPLDNRIIFFRRGVYTDPIQKPPDKCLFLGSSAEARALRDLVRSLPLSRSTRPGSVALVPASP